MPGLFVGEPPVLVFLVLSLRADQILQRSLLLESEVLAAGFLEFGEELGDLSLCA